MTPEQKADALRAELTETLACEAELSEELRKARIRENALRAEANGLRHNWEMAVSDGLKFEREAAALRSELEHLRGEHLHPCGAKESEMIALRAENERLLQYTKRDWCVSQLAAANALLDRLETAYDDLRCHPDAEEYANFADAVHDIIHDRPLAWQTAAPSICDECGAIHGTGNKNRLCPKASDYSPELEAEIARQWPKTISDTHKESK